MRAKALIVITALVGPLLFTYSANAFDLTPPTLVSATVSPATLPESGGTATVTVVISSPTYGLGRSPVISFILEGDASGNRSQGFGPMALISGDAKYGTYVSSVTFVAPLMSGIYRLTIYPLQDLAKNATAGFVSTNATVAIGVIAPTPTPSPSPTQSDAASKLQSLQSQVASLLRENASLTSQIARLTADNSDLKSQVMTLKKSKSLALAARLQEQLKKICSAKPKPKGC